MLGGIARHKITTLHGRLLFSLKYKKERRIKFLKNQFLHFFFQAKELPS